MGVLNRKKFGAAGASGEEEKEFYSTAEATQLNTLLRGGQAQPPGASEGATGGSSAEVKTEKTDSAGNETSNEQGQGTGRPKRSNAGARAKAAAEEQRILAEEAKAEKEKAKEQAKRRAAAKTAAATRAAAQEGGRGGAAKRTTSGPSTSKGNSLGIPTTYEGISGMEPLAQLSIGGTQMSDDYLQGLSIDSGDAPNFFQDATVSGMGPPPARVVGSGAWGGRPQSQSQPVNSPRHGRTVSGVSGGWSGGISGGSSGRSGSEGRYFNSSELTELFSIVRGNDTFKGARRKKEAREAAEAAARAAAQSRAAGGSGGLGTSAFDNLGLPEHMRQLPPIRTKSMDRNPLAGIGLPGSKELVTGLTPHGLSGTGLTPTGLTPGSLEGYPGMDSFSMNLVEAEAGGLSGLPGWTTEMGVEGHGKGSKKRKAVGGEGAKGAKAAKVTTGGKAAKGGKKVGKGKVEEEEEDDDAPLSGMIARMVGSGGTNAAQVAAEAAAAKLGIPLPSAPSITDDGDDDGDDDEEEENDNKKGVVRSRPRSWLPSEDDLVRTLVAQHGPRKWTMIATRLKTKTQKQVYARWRDYLQPGLTTKPWSKQEQNKLVELQAHVGNQWAVLARLMPGRSPNAIKNRFHATKRKMERHNKRDGSNLGPAGEASGGGKGDAAAARAAGAKKIKEAVSSALTDVTDCSREEAEAVEGLLLADTPTSLAALAEKEAAKHEFDAAVKDMEAKKAEEPAAEPSIEDRISEEVRKAQAKAASSAQGK